MRRNQISIFHCQIEDVVVMLMHFHAFPTCATYNHCKEYKELSRRIVGFGNYEPPEAGQRYIGHWEKLQNCPRRETRGKKRNVEHAIDVSCLNQVCKLCKLLTREHGHMVAQRLIRYRRNMMQS